MERRLTAILAADVVGYSRLMGADEAGTLAALNAHRKDLLDVKIAEHQGRIVKLTGDGMLIEFASVVNAVACAAAVQRGMADRNTDVPTERRIEFRIGVNLGDVIVEGEDIFGDGVNVAARLEGIAPPGGIAVSGTVRDHIGNRLDLEFEDLGEKALRNIEQSVRVYQASLGTQTRFTPAGQAQAEQKRPSIAVLPFANISGDPEQEYFADGITEDLITALSRIRWMFVIARNSSFVFKGRSLDVREIGDKLGVRYILEGSIRRAGNRVRVTGQLIDVTTGAHIWADRFDRDLDDIFALQDEITQTVVSAIEPSVRFAEIERTRSKPTESLAAYDLYLRALPEFAYSFTERGLRRAEAYLRSAVERDPNYADAWAALAECITRLAVSGWWDDWDSAAAQVLDAGNRAISADPKNGTALAIASYVLAQFGGNLDQAVERANRALDLHPNSADVRACCAWVRLC